MTDDLKLRIHEHKAMTDDLKFRIHEHVAMLDKRRLRIHEQAPMMEDFDLPMGDLQVLLDDLGQEMDARPLPDDDPSQAKRDAEWPPNAHGQSLKYRIFIMPAWWFPTFP